MKGKGIKTEFPSLSVKGFLGVKETNSSSVGLTKAKEAPADPKNKEKGKHWESEAVLGEMDLAGGSEISTARAIEKLVSLVT
ncbi:hypothetical protein TIFTF001_049095 [Ficus carica]|uniref:Uncharacterized protein n=1 Tax=Ficus carica TaxID=3494 RepID=A0AA88D0J9_FICCA|nr:hypothetical protein TIFTF001_049095 [Ficus carica]